jgi:hypothetical protein
MIHMRTPGIARQSDRLRAINVPLARWAAIVMPLTLRVHMSIDGPGDGAVGAPHLMQVDHRRALAVMPHTGQVIQHGPEREWNWTTVGTIRLPAPVRL